LGGNRDGRARYCGATEATEISDLANYTPDLPDMSNCFVARRRPPATLHGVVFDILAARTVEAEVSNVIRSSAGKRTVRYATGRLTALHCNLNHMGVRHCVPSGAPITAIAGPGHRAYSALSRTITIRGDRGCTRP
jgi:hypothetical protein